MQKCYNGSMTKQNTYITIGVVVVVLALIAIPLMRKFNAEPAENNEVGDVEGATTQSGTKTFSGTVSAVYTGCFYDGICSVTIDGKKIILEIDGLSLPSDTIGRLIGVDSIRDIEGRMGSFANVYAGLTPEGNYTIYGNKDYFVEIIMTSGK